MTMKKTELEKRAGLALRNAQRQAPNADRFGRAAALPADRRAQRERDRAAGLVPFAVKLPGDLVQALRERAGRDEVDLSTLVADLLRRGL